MYTRYSILFSMADLSTVEMAVIILLAVLVIFLICLMITLLVKVNRLQKKIQKFTNGKDGISLEESIAEIHKDAEYLKVCADKNKRDIYVLYKKAERTLQKVGLVKYDAFQQMGGQLSFSLAMLDEHDNGFIINSVHSTEGCYCYTKEIKKGQSKLTLGKEEAQALEIAMKTPPAVKE